MTDNEAVAESPLREQIARKIRMLLGWHNISAAELARQTGMKQPYVSRRMQGGVAFDVDDLEAIADVLGVHPMDLFPEREGGEKAPAVSPGPRVVARAGTNRRRLTASYPASALGSSPVRPAVQPRPASRHRHHSPDRPPDRTDREHTDRPVRLSRPATPTRGTRQAGDDVL